MIILPVFRGLLEHKTPIKVWEIFGKIKTLVIKVESGQKEICGPAIRNLQVTFVNSKHNIKTHPLPRLQDRCGVISKKNPTRPDF